MRHLFVAFLALGLFLAGCPQEAPSQPPAPSQPSTPSAPSTPSEPSTPSATCTDTDGGKDVYVQGRVDAGMDTGTDACLGGGSMVLEYYCSGNVLASEDMACPSGYQCISGACTQDIPCFDSDNRNPNELGVVQYGSERYEDECAGSASVREYTCGDAGVTYETIDCAAGLTCEGGACAGTPACVDSDGGKDYETLGTTSKGDESETDHCHSVVSVFEYYCNDKGEIDYVDRTCPGRCKDGVCVEDTTVNECRDTDGGQDVYEKGTVTYSGGKVTDACYSSYDVLEHWCTSDGNLGFAIIECEGSCEDGECVD